MAKKKTFRKVYIISLSIFLLWIIGAQSCMQFRISDRKAIKKFSDAGVALSVHTLRVDGFRMHYVQTGSDSLPTLLFIHGSPGSWTAFESYLMDKELLARYRLISVDRPGFGYSEYGQAKDLEEQSRLLGPVLDTINNGRPLFAIGHSLGGPMTIRLEADYPGSFSGIVLLAPSVDPKEEKPEKWRPWLIKTPLEFLVPGAFAPSNRELWYLKKDLIKLEADFEKISCPVWIIHGDKDSFVPVGNTDYAGRKLVNSPLVEVTIIKDANHFIPWEHYREIKEVLMKLPSK